MTPDIVNIYNKNKNFSSLYILTLCLLLLLAEFVETWNLSSFGVNVTNTPIKHVTVIKNKAYLSIPRKSKFQLMTFIEAPWPENSQVANTPRLFPSRKLQVFGDCDSLQSVVCSDADLSGQLYVLDIGFGQCPPKIVIYDGVTHKKVTGIIYDLNEVDGASLNSMVVDNYAVGGPRVYIGYPAEEGLIVFSFREHQWWFVKLSPPAEIIDFYPQKFRLEPQQLALSRNKPLLYFTSNNIDLLFSINTQVLRSLAVPHDKFHKNLGSKVAKINVKFEGQKMGPSEGLVCDGHHGLFYFIPRFYVLVCWDSRYELIAENHDIIIQSATVLPQVEQILLDLQSVWVLIGLPNKNGKHCVRLQKL